MKLAVVYKEDYGKFLKNLVIENFLMVDTALRIIENLPTRAGNIFFTASGDVELTEGFSIFSLKYSSKLSMEGEDDKQVLTLMSSALSICDALLIVALPDIKKQILRSLI